MQTAALPETHTVPGMETRVPDMPPLLKGKKKKIQRVVKDLAACKNFRGSQSERVAVLLSMSFALKFDHTLAPFHISAQRAVKTT